MQVDYSRDGLKKVLSDPHSSAFACVVAAAGVLGPEGLRDLDGDPADLLAHMRALEDELGIEVPEVVAHKILGLMHAITGEEYFTSPRDFRRLTDAITLGDAFATEDDDNPEMEDTFWGIYQVAISLGRNPVDLLSRSVTRMLERWIDDEAEEDNLPVEGLEEAEPFYEERLRDNKTRLTRELAYIGLSEEDFRQIDPELLEYLPG